MTYIHRRNCREQGMPWKFSNSDSVILLRGSEKGVMILWSFSAKMMIITALTAANISYTFSPCDSFMGCSIYTFLLLNKCNNLTLKYIWKKFYMNECEYNLYLRNSPSWDKAWTEHRKWSGSNCSQPAIKWLRYPKTFSWEDLQAEPWRHQGEQTGAITLDLLAIYLAIRLWDIKNVSMKINQPSARRYRRWPIIKLS